jgi:hypothetical protein
MRGHMKNGSFLYEVSDFLELGEMIEHEVAEEFVEFVEDADYGGH